MVQSHSTWLFFTESNYDSSLGSMMSLVVRLAWRFFLNSSDHYKVTIVQAVSSVKTTTCVQLCKLDQV